MERDLLTSTEAEAILRFIRLWVWPRFQTPVIREIEFIGGYNRQGGTTIEFTVNGKYFLCASDEEHSFYKHRDAKDVEVADLLYEAGYVGDHASSYQRALRLEGAKPSDENHVLTFAGELGFQINYMYRQDKYRPAGIDAYDPTFVKDDLAVTPLQGRIILLSE